MRERNNSYYICNFKILWHLVLSRMLSKQESEVSSFTTWAYFCYHGQHQWVVVILQVTLGNNCKLHFQYCPTLSPYNVIAPQWISDAIIIINDIISTLNYYNISYIFQNLKWKQVIPISDLIINISLNISTQHWSFNCLQIIITKNIFLKTKNMM